MSLLFEPSVDVDSNMKLVKTYVDEFLKTTFPDVMCEYVKQINQDQNVEYNISEFEMKITDTVLKDSTTLIINN